MSSPYHSSDRSTSSPRSTPSRQLVNGVKRERANGHHRPPRESIVDSPSSQLREEFQRIVLDDDRNFRKSLDAQTAEQEKLHRDALDRSFAYHQEVRRKAERARERLELEIEHERKRREEEEKREMDRRRRELAEREAAEQRRQLEEARQREKERQALEAIRREKEETERRADAQKQQEAQDRAQKRAAEEQEAAAAAAARRAREDAAARAREKQAQRPQPPGQQPNGTSPFAHLPTAPAPTSAPTPTTQSQPATTPSSLSRPALQGLVSSIEEREAVHNRYLDLHKRLKQMRQHVEAECKKQGPQVKDQVSTWRRTLRSCCGQQNKEDKKVNLDAMKKIQAILDQAAQIPEPSVDISSFIIIGRPDPTAAPTAAATNGDDASARGSGILLFLLNHLAKSIVRQLIEESSVDTKSADPLGVLAVTVFARPQYLFRGHSLIDILWAKYHRVCPILFGIAGRETSRAGRTRIGWWHEDDGGGGGGGGGRAFVDEQKHFNRMTGLAVGFSALTLRDFSKSKNRNPAPNRLWWEALARIVNTPPDQVQSTHYIVVKALIQDYVPRILALFGHAGLAALRKALVDFPRYGPREPREGERGGGGQQQQQQQHPLPVVQAVEAMPSILQRELHLTL